MASCVAGMMRRVTRDDQTETPGVLTSADTWTSYAASEWTAAAQPRAEGRRAECHRPRRNGNPRPADLSWPEIDECSAQRDGALAYLARYRSSLLEDSNRSFGATVWAGDLHEHYRGHPGAPLRLCELVPERDPGAPVATAASQIHESIAERPERWSPESARKAKRRHVGVPATPIRPDDLLSAPEHGIVGSVAGGPIRLRIIGTQWVAEAPHLDVRGVPQTRPRDAVRALQNPLIARLAVGELAEAKATAIRTMTPAWCAVAARKSEVFSFHR